MLFDFYKIDPLVGEYPPVTMFESGAIPRRMRRLLGNRMRTDLEHFIAVVNYILDDLGRSIVLSALKREAEILEDSNSAASNLQNIEFYSDDLVDDAGVLFACINRVDLSDFREPIPVLWHELFAALALALVGVSAEQENYYGSWVESEESIHDLRVLQHVVVWTRMAERSATLAEALELGWKQELQRQKDGLCIQNFKTLLSKKNRAAAFKRHEPTTKAVIELTRYYRERNFPSLRSAASKFCEEYPGQVRHLQPDNRVRTLAENLGKQLRSLGITY
jgi:hypothetical protein